MPTVITIQGADEPKKKSRCKRVERKNGCSIEHCLEETEKGPRWRFQAGTTRCPRRAR